ncbi:MAG: ABC transporter substrate-binding protein [Alphaproteobacteria bacterium]|nr:ABC transporter substrate-binding protein [Alphaproteobacteria bacterium]MCB9930298.1 ABC transporter substrate-binding protein [Alphaproteobacteria bacterium]
MSLLKRVAIAATVSLSLAWAPALAETHVTAAIGIDVTSTDPHKISGGGEYLFFSNVFEGLYGHNLDGSLAPQLATSYTVSDDGLVYTFKLREGVTFHNGEAFGADDVRYSWQRSNKPEIKNPRASIVTKKISDVVVVDPLTVEIHLPKPNASMIENLGEFFMIVPKDYIEKVGDDYFSKHPVGTGPYKFVSRSINENIELAAFKEHWGRVPGVDTLTLRIVPDPQTRIAMLQTGEADIILNVPPHQAKEVGADPDIDVVVNPSFQNYFININMLPEGSPFRDQRVRQALNYAVDKDTLIKRVMFGFATQSTAPCNRGVIGCDIDRKPYPYDPEKAKALLKEAGFDFSKTYKTFGLAPGRAPQSKEVAEATMFYLQQVGIKTSLEFLEYGAWLARLRSKDPEFALFWQNWTDYNADPMGRLPRGITKGGTYSWSDLPEADAMIATADSITDPDKRRDHLRKLFTMLYDNPPWIILWTTDEVHAKRSNIDWQPRANVSWPVFWKLSKH